ncbi:MAG TPA: lytic transglycosylase domain-containing protein [Solirubrobacteraceae bacterium]|nr:lytic transglycosylase domain-containing protein [Solirubrobacteraceae bacterium]
MSVESVVARVAQLQALLATPAGAPAQPASTAFAEQLAGASATPAATSDAAGPVAATAADWGASSVSATSATGGSLPASVPYHDEIVAAAKRHGLDPALLAGLIRQESGFNPNAGSSAGAQGLAQLMPATARGLGVTDPLDPAQSIEGGAKYLAAQMQRFGGDVPRALAAYNAGPGAVERFGGVPPYTETQNYVRSVQAFAAGYRGSAAKATVTA